MKYLGIFNTKAKAKRARTTYSYRSKLIKILELYYGKNSCNKDIIKEVELSDNTFYDLINNIIKPAIKQFQKDNPSMY